MAFSIAGMRCERGQATIEWVGLVLLASLVLAALGTALPIGDARSHGVRLANSILCAMKGGGCATGGDARLPATGVPDDRLVSSNEGPGAGSSPPGAPTQGDRQTPDVPCEAWWCDAVLRQCERVFTDRGGEALCKAQAAADARPNALVRFIKDRAGGCAAGAVGAKAFEPFADELLRGGATKSAKNARRALERGFKRAKDEVFKGRVKPGLIGCIGGALGL